MAQSAADVYRSCGPTVDGVDIEDVAAMSFSSWAPRGASRFPGDIDDDFEEERELDVNLKWDGTPDRCTSGSWVTQARGSGGSARGSGGWLCSANWGNHWSARELQDHMLRDVKSSPCHIFCLQEAEAGPMECLEKPPAKCGVERTERTEKESKFMGARGSETFLGFMICVRERLVQGIRRLMYRRSFDGTYKVTPKGGKKEEREPQIEEAASKIMIDIAKIRLRGRGADGDEDEETDEIAVCHAHLPRRAAKRDLNEGGRAYSLFFNDLAARGVGAVTKVGVGSDALN